MAKKDQEDKKKGKADEEIVDLASRIGGRLPEPGTPAPPASPPDEDPRTTRLDGPLPPRRSEQRDRPTPLGGDEPPPPIPLETEATPEGAKSGPIPSPRTPPGPHETDVVITPIPTLDEWHKFELALRKVRGVWQVRTEYYRHGVLKVRVTFEGEGRLAQSLRAGIPGYRVRVLGEDEKTLQISVSTENDDRRPG
ncbi:MAG: hypothetical protein AUH85_13905 [Chloroflexi bacterium 13_1_40CM_4_68_4]|nr:MAG: hypothetical protein AUH85_13905 [Chloroflexi bacterium 13_1_40CM_4_68_4]